MRLPERQRHVNDKGQAFDGIADEGCTGSTDEQLPATPMLNARKSATASRKNKVLPVPGFRKVTAPVSGGIFELIVDNRTGSPIEPVNKALSAVNTSLPIAALHRKND